jgi:pSer/pThr/pTyr-binding forkhead associated (FHA) protein
MRVGLFIPCYIDQFYPQVGMATVEVLDLGSLNGTYINGERVMGEQMLRHGDDIALGSTRARFDDGTGKPIAPPV